MKRMKRMKKVKKLFLLSFTAFFNSDILVGAVCCREVSENGISKLYIMTLGVLATYRNLKIGNFLSPLLSIMSKRIKFAFSLLFPLN
jgi:hypothetical protein